jgi:hypothetical protein
MRRYLANLPRAGVLRNDRYHKAGSQIGPGYRIRWVPHRTGLCLTGRGCHLMLLSAGVPWGCIIAYEHSEIDT